MSHDVNALAEAAKDAAYEAIAAAESAAHDLSGYTERKREKETRAELLLSIDALRDAALAAPRDAAPAPYSDSAPHLHVGDSSFESWYEGHPKASGGDKQLARDAYAAGMGDPLVCAKAAPRDAVPTEEQKLMSLLVDAVLALNVGWNAKEPEHLIAERIDLLRRFAVQHLLNTVGVSGAAPAAQPAAEIANPWKKRVIEALVVRHIYRAEHEDNPGKALADLVTWECEIALDPAVSSDAQALIDKGAAQPAAEAPQTGFAPLSEVAACPHCGGAIEPAAETVQAPDTDCKDTPADTPMIWDCGAWSYRLKDDPDCKHPDAPHGFARNRSHSEQQVRGPDEHTAPGETVQARPLTDEQIEGVWAGCSEIDGADLDIRAFARAIEAAHGIPQPAQEQPAP